MSGEGGGKEKEEYRKMKPNTENLNIHMCLREGWMILEHSLSLGKVKDKASKGGKRKVVNRLKSC